MVPKRDEQGRFAKKVPSRKVPPRKVPPRKVPPRKAPPRKVPPRKAPVKKVPPRKVPLRKVPPSKVPPRKVPPRKAPSRKASPRKEPSRKVPLRKALPSKASPRKAPPRKVSRKKVLGKKKILPKKLPSKKKVLPRKKVPPKKVRRRRRRVLPPIPARARAAEALMLGRLTGLMGVVGGMVEGSDVAVKTFVNADGSVDGELKVSGLPDELRSGEGAAELTAILSEVFRAFRPFPVSPPMGGKFWVSFAMRFGPQNESEMGKLAELYKKFRGLYQVGTYPAAAWHPTPIQLALTTGLKTIVEGVERRQGFPPTVILIRFTWTPDGRRPAHLAGEAGGGR